MATANGQCDQGAPGDCASSAVLSQTQISQESSRDLTLGQTALVCGAAELTVCNSTGDLVESTCSADCRQQAAGNSGQQTAEIAAQQTAGISLSGQQASPIPAMCSHFFVATRNLFSSTLVPVAAVEVPAVAPTTSMAVGVPTVAQTPASAFLFIYIIAIFNH